MEESKPIWTIAEEVEYSNLVFDKKVGSGAFGSVSHVTFKIPFKGYQEAAAKTILDLRKEEVEIMQKLQHPHIVTWIGFYSNGPINIILLEYAKSGSLFNYLKDISKKINRNEKRKWARQAALAIQYLHKNQWLHRDIKPQNCLLFKNNTLKLCDFGLARETDQAITLSSTKGTLQYMAPEIIKPDADNKAIFSIYTDIYAYGMLLLVIYTRKTPFAGMLHWHVMYRVGVGELKPDIPQQVPADIAQVMKQCWEVEPKKRPTINNILEETLYCKWTQQRTIKLSKPVRPVRVALHPNGDMVVASYDKLFTLDSDGKNKMELYAVEDQPNNEVDQSRGNIKDVRISPQGHVYVRKRCNKNIQVFSENGAYLNKFSFLKEDNDTGTVGYSSGATFDKDGHLLVVNAERAIITVHTCPSGEIVHQIKLTRNYRSPAMRIAVNKQRKILYHFCPKGSVYSKVVAIDYSGKEVFAFSPKIDEDVSDTWVYPGGIVCDSYDNVIVALFPYKLTNKGHVHKYSPTGEFMECIAQGLYYPSDMYMSHDASFIAVANYTSVVLIDTD